MKNSHVSESANAHGSYDRANTVFSHGTSADINLSGDAGIMTKCLGLVIPVCV